MKSIYTPAVSTIALALMLMGGSSLVYAQQGGPESICSNPALSSAEQSDCRAQMASAQTDAEKMEVHDTFEKKIQDKGQ